MLSSVNGFAKMELEGGGGILLDIKAFASENGLNSLPWSKLRPSLRDFAGFLLAAAGLTAAGVWGLMNVGVFIGSTVTVSRN